MDQPEKSCFYIVTDGPMSNNPQQVLYSIIGHFTTLDLERAKTEARLCFDPHIYKIDYTLTPLPR